MKKCSLCNSNKLKPIIDFGNQYVSNFVQKKDLQKVDKSELKLCFCNSCKLAQLSKVYNQKKMYSKYWYISGVNELMKKELRSVVEYATSFVKLNKGDSVLDCNPYLFYTTNQQKMESYIGNLQYHLWHQQK